MMSEQFQNVLDKIENSKDEVRVKMHNAENQGEKNYYCGVIGGLQLSKQIIEKEMLN